MKLFAGLFGRKANKKTPESTDDSFDVVPDIFADGTFQKEKPETAQTPAPALPVAEPGMAANDTVGAPVNIWDLDEDAGDVAPTVAAPDRAASRARRNRTRLIGFDKSDGDVVDLFNETPAVKPSNSVCFPVGWMLVTEGPGRGHCFSLVAGMSQIGRGEDQAIQLDFGDTSISRQNHAAIVYDPETRKFVLGHGGKANIVRLNSQPVIANEDIVDGDIIKIGDTVLTLKVLCGDDFDWSDTSGDEEREDVAIA